MNMTISLFIVQVTSPLMDDDDYDFFSYFFDDYDDGTEH